MAGKAKSDYLEDAARVIDGRVAVLEAELKRDIERAPSLVSIPSDRAAILEAQHCARLIRRLLSAPYRGGPYEVASRRWERGE